MARNHNTSVTQSGFFERHKYGIRRSVALGSAGILAAGVISVYNTVFRGNDSNARAAQGNVPALVRGYSYKVHINDTLSEISDEDLQAHHEIKDPSTNQINERAEEITKANPKEISSGGTVNSDVELTIPYDTEVTK